MDATQFVLILGALGTFITVLAAGFVTVFKAVSKTNAKTDEIHILVNGNLTAAREDLAAFRVYADTLVAQLKAKGVTPPEPPATTSAEPPPSPGKA